MREAILQAFDNVGGVACLERVAEDDPRTFCSLLGRLLPGELRTSINEPVVLKLRDFTGLTAEQKALLAVPISGSDQ